MNIVDWFRILNGMLAIVDFVMLFARLWGIWHKLARAQKLYFSSTFMFSLSACYGSFELLAIGDNRFTFRAFILSFALVILLIYLLEPRRAYTRRMGYDPLVDPGPRPGR